MDENIYSYSDRHSNLARSALMISVLNPLFESYVKNSYARNAGLNVFNALRNGGYYSAYTFMGGNSIFSGSIGHTLNKFAENFHLNYRFKVKNYMPNANGNFNFLKKNKSNTYFGYMSPEQINNSYRLKGDSFIGEDPANRLFESGIGFRRRLNMSKDELVIAKEALRNFSPTDLKDKERVKKAVTAYLNNHEKLDPYLNRQKEFILNTIKDKAYKDHAEFYNQSSDVYENMKPGEYPEAQKVAAETQEKINSKVKQAREGQAVDFKTEKNYENLGKNFDEINDKSKGVSKTKQVLKENIEQIGNKVNKKELEKLHKAAKANLQKDYDFLFKLAREEVKKEMKNTGPKKFFYEYDKSGKLIARYYGEKSAQTAKELYLTQKEIDKKVGSKVASYLKRPSIQKRIGVSKKYISKIESIMSVITKKNFAKEKFISETAENIATAVSKEAASTTASKMFGSKTMMKLTGIVGNPILLAAQVTIGIAGGIEEKNAEDAINSLLQSKRILPTEAEIINSETGDRALYAHHKMSESNLRDYEYIYSQRNMSRRALANIDQIDIDNNLSNKSNFNYF